MLSNIDSVRIQQVAPTFYDAHFALKDFIDYRRTIELLHVNQVYDALIEKVHHDLAQLPEASMGLAFPQEF
jgi:hypothetical protein